MSSFNPLSSHSSGQKRPSFEVVIESPRTPRPRAGTCPPPFPAFFAFSMRRSTSSISAMMSLELDYLYVALRVCAALHVDDILVVEASARAWTHGVRAGVCSPGTCCPGLALGDALQVPYIHELYDP